MGSKARQRSKQATRKTPATQPASKPVASSPSNPSKEATPPKRGKQKKSQRADSGAAWEGDALAAQLAALGLRIKPVAADGNCFFRAVADQLEGEEGDHLALRQRVVAHIVAQRTSYEPFVEDDEPFDKYCKRMAEEGTWAGHLELQAASQVLQANFWIFQADQPVWRLHNFPKGAPQLYLSYHDGEHYNSVRKSDDYGSGPPDSISLQEEDGKLAGAAKTAVVIDAAAEERVSQGSGCYDKAVVRQVLADAHGNIDEAVELLVARCAAEAAAAPATEAAGLACNSVSAAQPIEASSLDSAEGDGTSAGSPPAVGGSIAAIGTTTESAGTTADVQRPAADNHGGSNSPVSTTDDASPATAAMTTTANDENAAADAEQERSRAKVVKPARNRPCPCGSSKRYKNCCGVVAAAAARRQAVVAPEAAPTARVATLYI